MRKIATLIFIILIALSSGTPVFAQQTQLNQAQSDRAALEAELAQLEAEIAQKTQELKGQQGQSLTIQNEIKQLQTQISKSKLDIKAKTLTIKKLGGEIGTKQKTIQTLAEKIDTEKTSLGHLVRQTREYDDQPLLAVVLSRKSISDFYSDIDTYSEIKGALKTSVDEIQGNKKQTEVEKKTLEQKQNAELDAKAALEAAKAKVERDQAKQQTNLKVSKQSEQQISAYLTAQQQKAAGIRARLFSLAGGSAAIPFGDALGYA